MYMNVIFILIFCGVIGGWAVSEFLGALRWSKARGTRRDRGSMPLSLMLGLLGLVASFVLPVILPETNIAWQPGTFVIGLVIALVGIVWRWYAILTLGKYFTGQVLIQEGHVIVQHGPYKFVRHPSYTGAFLLALGIGTMIGNWVSLLVIAGGLFLGLFYRIPVEEQALLAVAGYKEYMQRTKRIIPFVF